MGEGQVEEMAGCEEAQNKRMGAKKKSRKDRIEEERTNIMCN